jgi:hypothetical protein
MTTDTYSVGEVAARIARSDDPGEIALITRQLRHWTALGLLTPVEGLHTGSGRHRRYDRRGLFVAAVYELIARHFRADAPALKAILHVAPWAGRLKPTNPIPTSRSLLQVTFHEDGVHAQEGVEFAVPDSEIALVIDLTAVAERVFR